MKVCEIKQKGGEFKDEIYIEIEGLWNKAEGGGF